MRIGLYNGCFDVFHDGHRHALAQALRQCDHLIVAVNSDASVRRLKGECRPVDALHIRLRNANNYAHAVIPFEGRVDELVMQIRPHILFVGYDHSAPTVMAMRKPGWKTHALWDRVRLIQLTELPGFSTTRILDEAERHAPTRA